MAIPKPDNKPLNPPQPLPADTPQNPQKVPQDNTAAKQAPQETRSAVKNAFGSVPGDASPKQPDNAPKVPAPEPQAPAKTPDGYDVGRDRNNNPVAVRPDGTSVADPKGNAYAVTEDGKYRQSAAGNYLVYDPRGNPVAALADGKFVTDTLGNALMLDKNGNYLPGAVYDKHTGLKVSVDASGKVQYHDGRPVAAGDDGKTIQGESGNPAVYNSKGQVVDPMGKNTNGIDVFKNVKTGLLETSKPGGPVFRIDPKTNDIARDAYGNPLAVDDNSQFIKTPDGKQAVHDSHGHLAFVNPSTGRMATDGSGNPYALAPDGRYARTEDGYYAVWDKANGNNMFAIDSKTGQAISDSKGNPYALDENGKYLKTPDGNALVYASINGKSLAVATDANSDFLLFRGKPAAVDKLGAQMKTPDGNHVVYDKRGNPIAVGTDGKVVTDKFGNPVALTPEGNIIPGAVIDKKTGIKGIPHADGKIPLNPDGLPVARDDYGNPVVNESAAFAYLDPAGRLVFYAGKGANGAGFYKDAKTGEFETITKNGAVYKFDPTTNDVARDANGNILPPDYDPVDDDPTRPLVRPNDEPETTVSNLPRGRRFGVPMRFKDEMFDEHGNLDVDKLTELAGIYDPRVLYDALINSTKDGGWDNLEANGKAGSGVIHPNEEQSRQAIAAIIAWQNANGKYSPFKAGNMPPILFIEGGKDYPGFARDGAIYISADYKGAPLANPIFHELNQASASAEFRNAYPYATSDKHMKVIAEFLASDWTGDKDDSPFETRDAPGGFPKLEDAVMAMGDGDRNKGMDLLKRAFFTGDPAALEMLKKYFPPGQEL